jgi:uncharacterized membrane protein
MSTPLSGVAGEMRGTGSALSRIASLDVVRGAVMVLMAIDHVRVYSGLPAGGPAAGIFFTRWVTHFCAPAFVFLAGTAAFLYAARRPGSLTRFLLTRGAWLILLELTVIRFSWTFNFDFGSQMAGVIWVIGWCMILLAGITRLGPAAAGALGIAIMAGHNLLNAGAIGQGLGQDLAGALWRIGYVGFWGGPVGGGGGPGLIVLYAIVPWIGVMAAGYGFGALMELEPARRTRLTLRIGIAAVALFLVLRGLNIYGDPWPWTAQMRGGDGPGMPALLAFLNTAKYPASLSFLLMTLGPTLIAVALLERKSGRLAGWLEVFGKVPFFYYVLHIPLIHLLALAVSRVRTGVVDPWLFANHPMGAGPAPAGFAWSLPLLYLVFAIAILLLYFPCRWFAGLKARRKEWWLAYL